MSNISLCSASSTPAAIQNAVASVLCWVLSLNIVSPLFYSLHLSVQDICLIVSSLLHDMFCTQGIEPTCQLDTSSVLFFEQECSPVEEALLHVKALWAAALGGPRHDR